MSTEITTVDGEIIEQRAPMTLFGTDNPEAVVQRASAVATSLGAVINERKLFASIGGKKHVQVEGWTLLGSMLGVFAEIEWSRPLENGWEARAVARTLNGNVVGAAEAMCTTNEGRWRSADTYAVRSMAQTRAVSKALRMPLGFIMHLAGYSATPAEEVPDEQPERGAGGDRESRSSSPSRAPAPASQEQQLRNRALELAIARFGDGVEAAMKRLADEVGVPVGGRATVEQLHQIIALIEQPASGVPTVSAGGEAGAETPVSPDDPTPDAHTASAVPVSATPEAVDDSPVDGPPVALSMDDVLEAAGPGAEEIPPAPGTDAFKALDSKGKLAARVWHQTHPAEAVA
jgi:hypothetical protein